MGYICRKWFIIRNCLMLLWRLKIHNLLSVYWRLREANGVIQYKSKAWEPGPLRVRQDWCPSSAIMQKEMDSFFLQLFVLFRLSTGWMMPIQIGESKLLYWVHQFKSYFHPETPPQTHPGIIFNQISGHLVIQSSWHKKLTITPLKTILPNITHVLQRALF